MSKIYAFNPRAVTLETEAVWHLLADRVDNMKTKAPVDVSGLAEPWNPALCEAARGAGSSSVLLPGKGAGRSQGTGT